MATLRGWSGPSGRGIVNHPIASMGAAQSRATFEPLVKGAEDETLTLRVAEVLPAARAADAHRRVAAGGVRAGSSSTSDRCRNRATKRFLWRNVLKQEGEHHERSQRKC
jgi:hypothetical protein